MLLISIFLSGISLCAFLWAVMRPAASRPFAAGIYSNHVLLHLMWPWVVAFKPLCEPFVTWRMRARLDHQLRLAALAPVWTPADLLALQAVVFMFSGITFVLGLRAWAGISTGSALFWGIAAAALIGMLPRRQIVAMGARRQYQMSRELPFLLDMTTLCVEAGLSLHEALQRAVRYGPAGPLQQELQHTITEIRAGTPRMTALQKLAVRTDLDTIASLVAALQQADQSGSSLGPLLRSQSEQRRSEQFLRAEELALKAPVKMLFPMVLCIFPCTFLIIGFPVAMKVFNGAW